MASAASVSQLSAATSFIDNYREYLVPQPEEERQSSSEFQSERFLWSPHTFLVRFRGRLKYKGIEMLACDLVSSKQGKKNRVFIRLSDKTSLLPGNTLSQFLQKALGLSRPPFANEELCYTDGPVAGPKYFDHARGRDLGELLPIPTFSVPGVDSSSYVRFFIYDTENIDDQCTQGKVSLLPFLTTKPQPEPEPEAQQEPEPTISAPSKSDEEMQPEMEPSIAADAKVVIAFPTVESSADLNANYTLFVAHYANDDPTRTLVHLNQLSLETPFSAGACLNIAGGHGVHGQYLLSKKWSQKALQIKDCNVTRAMLSLATAHMYLGELSEAEKIIREGFEKFGNNDPSFCGAAKQLQVSKASWTASHPPAQQPTASQTAATSATSKK